MFRNRKQPLLDRFSQEYLQKAHELSRKTLEIWDRMPDFRSGFMRAYDPTNSIYYKELIEMGFYAKDPKVKRKTVIQIQVLVECFKRDLDKFEEQVKLLDSCQTYDEYLNMR